MDANRLKCFIITAEQLSFSKAADLLYISQPALSYQIAELERELNAKLFVRDKRRVLLTAAGANVLPIARQIVADCDLLVQTVLNEYTDGTEIRNLSIAREDVNEELESLQITEAIRAVRKRNSQADICLNLAPSAEVIEGVQTAKYDIGFSALYHGQMLPEDFVSIELIKDHLVFVSVYDLTPGTLSEFMQKAPLWLDADDTVWNCQILDLLENIDLTPEIVYAKDVRRAITQVLVGNGAVIMSKITFARYRSTYPALKSCDFGENGYEYGSYVFWRRGDLNPLIQELVGQILDNVENSDE